MKVGYVTAWIDAVDIPLIFLFAVLVTKQNFKLLGVYNKDENVINCMYLRAIVNVCSVDELFMLKSWKPEICYGQAANDS